MRRPDPTRAPSKYSLQRSPNSGFTVVELLIVVAIIFTISAIAVPNLFAAMDQVKIARAVGDIHTIGLAVQEYDVLNGQYPDTLTDVGYGSTVDPWGNPYQYLSFADVKGKGKMRKDRFLVPINTYFDLYSMGKDGESTAPLTAKQSQDDIIWANDGGYVGPASKF
ncbi:MAG TPA: prepilin-type N-terminal cleavage/methylation domain-containing protein [Terriglobales bacterium]|nr:prepilin-type N-terminal cleavage/methylation domain-containing protein [Terriglobales bacterium]